MIMVFAVCWWYDEMFFCEWIGEFDEMFFCGWLGESGGADFMIACEVNEGGGARTGFPTL